ncbi:hypothetical protein SLA2020_134470 [Shorea laevis]
MVGMNLCGFYLCMITSICDTLKVTMTGLFRLACALAMNASSLCQGLLRIQGRPAAAYDDQGLVLAIAFGGYIRMFGARKYEEGPFDIFSVGTLLSAYNVKPVSSNSTLEASFSPEGMFVISGDGIVHAWSVRSGKEVPNWLFYNIEPSVMKWAPGSLMFATGSTELSFWIPDLSKLAAYVGRK